MIIQEIENLERNPTTGLYDLTFLSTSDKVERITLYSMVLSSKYNMRIDLLAKDLYHKENEILSIMTINDITNPYSIKEGMVIYYVSVENLVLLKKSNGNFDKIRTALINTNKGKKTDGARTAYLNEKKTLPITAKDINRPTVLTTDTAIKINPDF